MASFTGLLATERAKAETRQSASAYQLLRSRLIEATYTDLRTILVDAVEANPLLELDESGIQLFSEEEAVGLVEGAVPIASEHDGFGRRTSHSASPTLDNLRDFAAVQVDSADYRIELRLLADQFLPSKKNRDIADAIIDMIDERGYFEGNLSAIAIKCNCTVDEVQTVLKLIQEHLRDGIGARDAIEAVCLQLDDPDDRALAWAMLSNSLDDLRMGRFAKIAKSYGTTKQRIVNLLSMLMELKAPSPSIERPDNTVYIHPDVIARTVDGQLIAQVTEAEAPLVHVSSYAKLLKGHSLTNEERTYIESHVRDASDFITALEARWTLMESFAQTLVSHERAFLTTANEAPTPLSMQSIADELGVSISTVSRLCKNKHILTDRGIFPFGYFFMKSFVSVKTSTGQQTMQSDSIAQLITSLIEVEDPASPLSDQQIADAINSEKGICLARRTVAKYRMSAGIPNSSFRRQGLGER